MNIYIAESGFSGWKFLSDFEWEFSFILFYFSAKLCFLIEKFENVFGAKQKAAYVRQVFQLTINTLLVFRVRRCPVLAKKFI